MLGPPDRPLRIIHVVNALGFGGMEVGVVKLVNRQDSAEFAPMICVLRGEFLEARALLTGPVPVFALDKRPGRDWSMAMKLAGILRRERIDIVHSHNWPTFLYSVLATRLAGTPILIHGEHGYEDPSSVRRRLGLKRFLARHTTRLATVSPNLTRILVDLWRVPPERITTIPNGVDLARFRAEHPEQALRSEFGLSPGNRVVLSVGRIGPVKDYPTLVRGFAETHRSHPEARLLIVGEGDPGERKPLERLAETLGVRDAVRFPGARKDIPQILNLGDVYVNTSRFEGMSNTILEAMASGKPVVATEVGGNPDLVREGETGYLIPVGSDHSLANRLERLLTDPGLMQRMGLAGRAVIERDHPLPETIQNYNDLYLETWTRHRLRSSAPRSERTRRALARGIRYSGLDRAREAVAGRTLAILTYHRVLPLHESLAYPYQSMTMPRDLFEAQMAHARRAHQVLAFPEAMRLLREGRLPKRALAVTFDDGYADNYEHAWPILRKFDIPAMFFVVTGALDGRVRLLWDEVVSLVGAIARREGKARSGLAALPTRTAEIMRRLDGPGDAPRVGEAMLRELNRVSLEERRAILNLLRGAADEGEEESTPPLLTWNQVREMRRSGMDFGAHTDSHPFLDELREDEARREIEGSVRILESRLEEPVRHFSYPRGRFKEDVKKLLEDAGMESAVTTTPGVNRTGADPYALRRIDAGYCRLVGGPDSILLDAELQAWFAPMRNRQGSSVDRLV